MIAPSRIPIVRALVLIAVLPVDCCYYRTSKVGAKKYYTAFCRRTEWRYCVRSMCGGKFGQVVKLLASALRDTWYVDIA